MFHTQPSYGTDTQGREGLNPRVRRISRGVAGSARAGAEATMRAISILSAGLAPRGLMVVPARVESSGRRYPPSAPSSGFAATLGGFVRRGQGRPPAPDVLFCATRLTPVRLRSGPPERGPHQRLLACRPDMGSLIKKRRKRMRKKKHKKMLKATRWQRRAGK